jgi:hypothetical protein
VTTPPSSSDPVVAAISREVGQLAAIVQVLREEVQGIRHDRHGLLQDVAALRPLPRMLADMSSELRTLSDQVASITVRLAAADAVRDDHERAGVWVRWGFPLVWAAVVGVFAWFATWWNGTKGGGN